MQTRLPAAFLDTPDGKLADSILRSCVHCGFCTATCPTYLETGNELDSPRGRIYLLKEMLENNAASQVTRDHLERCLGCQGCETTCPSSVQYHTLLDIGRQRLAVLAGQSWPRMIYRRLLLYVLDNRLLFGMAVMLGRLFRWVLPASLSRQLPGTRKFPQVPDTPSGFTRQVVLLDGCVQGQLRPDTNSAAAVVLGALGIKTRRMTAESCCGAMHYHSDFQAAGQKRARNLVDQVCAALDDGAEAVISTASGCGSFIKDYPGLLRNDELYRDKAQRVAQATRDIGEFLQGENLDVLRQHNGKVLTFHNPCSLQHGQQQGNRTEVLLRELGFTLAQARDAHLCCGSAGTYSLFQPALAQALKAKKVFALEKAGGSDVATANIGCQCHLASGTSLPVRHWIEYVAEGLPGGSRE